MEHSVSISQLSDLPALLSRASFVILDLWAEWCGPCIAFLPTYDEIARIFTPRVAFGKMNVDDVEGAIDAFDVITLPKFIFYKEGKIVATKTLDSTKALFAQIVQQFLRGDYSFADK